jgi:rubrerythrin
MSRKNLCGGKIMVTTNDSSKAISDLEFDLLTVLKNKSEAVQMYDTYIKDAENANSQPCVELLRKLQQADREQAQELRHHLQEVMQKGSM